MEPIQKKRKVLNYDKCSYCRRSKKKCEPNSRKWPGEKCQRCIEKGYPCSENQRATEGHQHTRPTPASTLVPRSTLEDLNRKLDEIYIHWTDVIYSSFAFIHLFRSAKALEEKLKVIHDGVPSSATILAHRFKLMTDKLAKNVYSCGGFLPNMCIYRPGLLKNIELCMTYFVFLLKNSNDGIENDMMMSTAVQFLAMHIDDCERVAGDLSFSLIVQEITILQAVTRNDLGSLASQLCTFRANYLKFVELKKEFDVLPPTHQLLLLTRSNMVIKGACLSGLLPQIADEVDVFGRRLLETALDEIPNPDTESFIGLRTASDEEDVFGRSTLHVACMNGSEEVARDLLDSGEDANIGGPMGASPLHLALAYGHESVVDSLLMSGQLDINCLDDLQRIPLSSKGRSVSQALIQNRKLKDNIEHSMELMRGEHWINERNYQDTSSDNLF